MTSIVKLQKKGKLTIPNYMREQIGLAEGDYIQVASRGDKIILELAKVVTDTAAQELTPAQKRKLDERLAKAWLMSRPAAFTDHLLLPRKPAPT